MEAAQAKKAVGLEAAKLIKSGMKVGLGTGSTAKEFIQALGKRVREEGLEIRTFASSKASEALALEEGIPLLEPNAFERLDMTVDGADEIDPQKRMIKGGGGALLREKVLAQASDEMVIIVDEKKCVAQLGAFPLPVEILPYCFQLTLRELKEMGLEGQLRKKGDERFISDNGNYIFDIALQEAEGRLEELHSQMIHIPGVLETGLFLGLAGRVLVARLDGTIEIR